MAVQWILTSPPNICGCIKYLDGNKVNLYELSFLWSGFAFISKVPNGSDSISRVCVNRPTQSGNDFWIIYLMNHMSTLLEEVVSLTGSDGDAFIANSFAWTEICFNNQYF